MAEILNYDVYNDRMRRSMWDKAFFMDKIPGANLIIDFGCADGSLIRFLQELFPAMHYIGYDIDPQMVERANAQRTGNVWFFSGIDEVLACMKELGMAPKETAVNFSSVFHELFHYGFDRAAFDDALRQIAPQYLIVRDMLYVSGDDGAPASAQAAARIREELPEKMLREFEAAQGPISLRRNLVQLLLKYKYVENWDRECAENYFSYTWADIAALLDPEGKYRTLFSSRYVLPWCREDIENRFGIDLGHEITTHCAVILGRRPAAGLVRL